MEDKQIDNVLETKSRVKTRKQGRNYVLQNTLILVLFLVFLIIINLMSALFLGYSYMIVLILFSIIVFFGLFVFLTLFRAQGRIIKTEEQVVKEIMDAINKPMDEKPILVEEINIPADHIEGAYVGSTKNKTYHMRDCRLVKAIKPEFKLINDNPLFFKKRKFKSCKVCLKKKKK